MRDRTLTVHATMTDSSHDIGRVDVARRDRVFGMAGIGCHVILKRDGSLVTTSRSTDAGCAYDTGALARESYGLLLVGGADHMGNPQDNWTPKQIDTLTGYVAAMNFKAVVINVPGFPEDLKQQLTQGTA